MIHEIQLRVALLLFREEKIYILLLRFFLVFINNGTFIKVNKRIIFFGAIILLIELSGHGIFASLYRLLMSAN